MYSDLSKIVFRDSTSNSSDVYQQSNEFASFFESLAADLKIAGNLRQVGIKESDISLLATEAMKQTRLLPNNPRDMQVGDATRIYEQAF